MSYRRLDTAMVDHKLVSTRSQAASWIRLGKVKVDGEIAKKPGMTVRPDQDISLTTDEKYVSRAGLKLASVARALQLDFNGKVVLDVGSSTGGFTDYALQHGATKVYAVDVGTEQLHPSLRDEPRVELHEKTDIRDFNPKTAPDIVVIDVSFISLRQILPHIASIVSPQTIVVAMLKPQFEASRQQVNKGVIKNKTIRRDIIHDFERWVGGYYRVIDKADSQVTGKHGNQERFYCLRRLMVD